ncbi:hypothetical protein B0675_39230 [Streptomyces sp. M41(2017)]|uniref:hypothetical protein n=1 Tax=Streptomyces sp. M41(2017) TaxID=1955065 RepID=UPI0009C055F0|nr:hypothetical protein [Streptomyces sp. M41(2017)]OQQ13069.1 hypothetical protein B0675_39230 [Streptomyces sp. M41(2017)]
MAGFKINQRGIDQMMRQIQKGVERSAQRHPITVPIDTEAAIRSGRHGDIELDPYLPKALLWLHERAAEQRGHFQDMAVFTEREHLSQDEAGGLALQLEQHGFVQIARSFGGDDTAVHLTDEGRVEVRRLKQLAGDRVRRADYATNALLRWLYDQHASVDPGRFADTPTAYFAGTPLTTGEISGAVAELVGWEFAESPIQRSHNDPYLLRITDAGRACIRSGRAVRNHMDTQSAAGTTNNYHGSTVVHGEVSGGVVLTGDHNTVNAGNGIDAGALADLVQGLRDITPQLGLDPVDAEDFQAEVAELELVGGDPEQGGRIWRRIMRLAGPALTTTVATGVGQQFVELGASIYN